MSPDGLAILDQLRAVEAERVLRAADPALQARVDAVKHFQHARFEKTYADLLAQPRYARAARFFLDELYGPHDFTQRDAQFARIVPGLVRLFPHDIVTTVRALGELHAMSERLDTAMGRVLGDGELTAAPYVAAWQAVGEPGQRQRQIDLMLGVGRALERYTKNPFMRHSLRLMRGPAQAMGMGALQSFLESGFDTFRDMRGAEPFLRIVGDREKALAEALFAADAVALATSPPPTDGSSGGLLGQLP
jgi:hypothetical protein